MKNENNKSKTVKSEQNKKIKQEITKDSLIGDVLAKYREKVIPIFFEFGFHCVGCMIASSESIGDGAQAHGFDDTKIDEFVKALNDAVSK